MIAAAGNALLINALSVVLPKGADRQLALDNISLEVRLGETLCLIGASGSGKSVLAAAMMAALPAGLTLTSGEILLGRVDLTTLAEPALRSLRGNRIALVPQNPMAALNPLMTVGDQIGEVFAIHSELDCESRAGRVAALLEAVGLADVSGIASRYPHQLSGGQCQRVAIAMAVAMAPDVLIADEPTTALDTVAAAQILQLLARLKTSANYALVFISHDIAIVGDIADRVGVLEGGQIVELGRAKDVFAAPQHAVTQALLAASRPPRPRLARPSATPVLEVSGLGKSFAGTAAVADVNFNLNEGNTLAIVGRSGSGKSTLARLIVQLIIPDTGIVVVDGINLLTVRGTARRQSRRLIQMVFQDPFGALNPRHRIGDAIARSAMRGGADRNAARADAMALLNLVGLPPAAYDRYPVAFSGGQRQRIGIARALAIGPRVLICDESVSGLDPVVQAEVLELLETIQADTGLAILFITHDLRAAAAIADQVIVMDAGRIVEAGATGQVLSEPQSDAAKALVSALPVAHQSSL